MVASVDATGVEPETFLSQATGEPRGLWSRGPRWVAHQGVLQALTADGVAGGDRFARIAEQAQRLPPSAGDEGRVRLYGGFAFGDDHQPGGAWSGFPSALFHLPRAELTGDASGEVRLRLRAVVGPDEVEQTHGALRHRALELRDALREAAPRIPPESAPGLARMRALRRDTWEGAVEEILEAISEGSVSKVVLARTLDLETPLPPDPVDVAAALRRENPATHVFMFEPVPGRVLLGAAPEAVATLRSGVFHATAVAGSVACGASVAEQARLAEALLTSAKDRAEQRIVVDDMVARLEPLAADVRAEDEPRVLSLARIQHLETEIRARVDARRTILELVAALHPTPAVCGVPREGALELLREEEPFHRGWYAGPVGWFTREGDGHFVPALRTAIGEGTSWRLFAGAGIVDGSRPAAEWDETAIKFLPVLRALAASGARIPESIGLPSQGSAPDDPVEP